MLLWILGCIYLSWIELFRCINLAEYMFQLILPPRYLSIASFFGYKGNLYSLHNLAVLFLFIPSVYHNDCHKINAGKIAFVGNMKNPYINWCNEYNVMKWDSVKKEQDTEKVGQREEGGRDSKGKGAEFYIQSSKTSLFTMLSFTFSFSNFKMYSPWQEHLAPKSLFHFFCFFKIEW